MSTYHKLAQAAIVGAAFVGGCVPQDRTSQSGVPSHQETSSAQVAPTIKPEANSTLSSRKLLLPQSSPVAPSALNSAIESAGIAPSQYKKPLSENSCGQRCSDSLSQASATIAPAESKSAPEQDERSQALPTMQVGDQLSEQQRLAEAKRVALEQQLEEERIATERQAAAQRLAAARLEQQRLAEAERVALEQQAKQQLEQERIATERQAETRRLAAARLEQQRLAEAKRVALEQQLLVASKRQNDLAHLQQLAVQQKRSIEAKIEDVKTQISSALEKASTASLTGNLPKISLPAETRGNERHSSSPVIAMPRTTGVRKLALGRLPLDNASDVSLDRLIAPATSSPDS